MSFPQIFSHFAEPSRQFLSSSAAIVFAISFALMFAGGCGTGKPPISAMDEVRTLAGTNREFAEPFGIAAASGGVYVSDGEAGTLHFVGNDGSVKLISGEFKTPSHIAVARSGEIIVADTGSHTIKAVSPSGETRILAGTDGRWGYRDGEAASALFNGPIGIALAGERIYVADSYNDRIRVIENGNVTTLAGGPRGFVDGTASEARFDTPCGLAVWRDGRLLVADTGNGAVRVVENDGHTRTLAGHSRTGYTDGIPESAEILEPFDVEVGNIGEIYVSDGDRIRVIGRRLVTLVETIAGEGPGFADGPSPAAMFNRPTGLALDEDGELIVADAENGLVRVFSGEKGAQLSRSAFDEFTSERDKADKPSRWPYRPSDSVREIAGTFGEIRGEIDGRQYNAAFHNGLDITGGYGETARFIADEKVLHPIAVRNIGTLRELIRLPRFAYIHIRIGRESDESGIGDNRYLIERGSSNKPRAVRVARGTEFRAGEAIGTLNAMNHVHLVAGVRGREGNGLGRLKLPGVGDSRQPVIGSVTLYRKDWSPVETVDGVWRIKSGDSVRIVAEAYDQMDGNADRRRLGLYRLGYSLQEEDGEPTGEPDSTNWTITFDGLPETEQVGLVYADGSSSGATGTTIFRYIVSNALRNGRARESVFVADVPVGREYILSVFAGDFFGNQTIKEIPVRVD